VSMAREFLLGNDENKQRGKLLKQGLLEQFGEDTVFLGTIGRLIKIESEEYLRVISEIMKQNPNTVYLACGTGNKEKVENLMEKVGIDLKRVVFTGQVNPHMFGWIIDVWINTYPLVQGVSQEEYHEKGNGIVIQSELIIKNNFITDYEELKKEYKDKMELFLEFFELSGVEKNINRDEIRLKIYKKYNKIDQNFEKDIKECISYIYKGKNSNERWFRRINKIINNKNFFEMQRWIIYNFWKKEQEYKQKQNKFLKIIN